MSGRSLVLVVVVAAALAAGCGADRTSRRAEGFDPRVPLRVAVLPFVDRAGGDTLVSTPLTAAIDLVPILFDDEYTRKNAATILRLKLAESVHRTALDPIEVFVVDSVLAHRGIDAVAAHDGDRAKAARALGVALGADAVFFGEVVAWDRSWHVVDSSIEAGLRVELRETTTGAVLFEHEVRRSERAGITKLPIAYSPEGAAQSIVGESLKGLRNSQFAALSDEIAREIVAGLAPSAEARAKAKAPEIYFVAHSAAAPLRPGEELVVVAAGTPGARATFEVGDDAREVPMTESAPGTYRGTVRAWKGAPWREATVRVRLVSPELRASTMTIGKPGVTVVGAGAGAVP